MVCASDANVGSNPPTRIKPISVPVLSISELDRGFVADRANEVSCLYKSETHRRRSRGKLRLAL
jgi:hypothetical protein